MLFWTHVYYWSFHASFPLEIPFEKKLRYDLGISNSGYHFKRRFAISPSPQASPAWGIDFGE